MKTIFALAIATFALVLVPAQAGDGKPKNSRQNMEFSLVNPTANDFVVFAETNGITKERMEEAYRSPMSDPENSFLYALAYDYAYELPDLAPFYRNASDSNIAIGDKSALYEYLDYLIRINEPDEILKMLTVPKCYGMQSSYRCLYYLGAAKYLKTGRCNSNLRNAARNGIKSGLYRRLCR
ncbi:MAG: hypothetical protein B6D63_02845 [Candidatus Latescibacteria bacterium 4484_7]|nr:MAG: hypothetical protein B6D63_02845 [Candidatus Latescibacteria bacterium 4484_7]